MAESDAAGPGATGGPNSRALTREDIDRLVAESNREWESLTPEERARRKAEAEKADREAYEAAMDAARPTLEAIERAAAAAGSGPGALFHLIPDPAKWLVNNPPLDLALLESIEPAPRPPSAEEIRAAVAAGLRDAMTESTDQPGPDSKPLTTTPGPGLFTGGAAWAAGQKALLVARFLRELDGLPANQPSNESGEPPAAPSMSAEETPAAAQGGAAADVVKKGGIVRVPREVPLADRLEADWSSEAGRRFLIGEKVRTIAAHYGVSHGSLYGVRLWKEKILPVRQKAQKGSKAAAWRDGFSREAH